MLIIFAVYIVSMEGKILYSENFHSPEEIPNEILVGGLFNALQGIALEISQGSSEMKSIEIEGLSYHFRSFGFYRVVLVTDVPNRPEIVLQNLGYRFMKLFGQKLDKPLTQNDLIAFKKALYEIIGKDYTSDESKTIVPTKKFGTGEIFDLPHDLQGTALAMITIQEGTLEEIAQESGLNEEKVIQNILSLQQLGFVGNKIKEGKKIYFCST